jgi:hypothetical protein
MRKLTQLRIDEVSACVKDANPGARVLIRKSDDAPPYFFDDIMLRKATEPADTGDEEPPELSATLDELVTELVSSAGLRHINPVRARRWLLTTPSGQALLLQRTQKKETPMPTVDIMKAISVMEDVLNAQVTPRDGESFAKAFSRKYETDESYRRQWQNHQDTKMMLSKVTRASMTPTFAVVGDTNVADDSAEAVRLLTEMAEQTGQSLEVVFSAPENKELAARTYTMHHRPNASSLSGSELQRSRG